MVNGPKDIVDSILEASSAAMLIDNYLYIQNINSKNEKDNEKKTIILDSVQQEVKK